MTGEEIRALLAEVGERITQRGLAGEIVRLESLFE
jgi:hypothetical protein